jgi:hypothetical protein
MVPAAVFVKTAAGSEAERERSRLAGAADASFLRQDKKII